jgi:antirestriction protein ArdC
MAEGLGRRIPSYRITVNDRLETEERFVTLVHELGHVFCGHLGACSSRGNNDEGSWPDRRNLGKHEKEIEAEIVAYMVAARAGLVPASAKYLSDHASRGDISLVNQELIVRSAARVERLAGIRNGSMQF